MKLASARQVIWRAGVNTCVNPACQAIPPVCHCVRKAWERRKGCREAERKPFVETLRVSKPVRESWPAPGSEFCVVGQRCPRRSVNSECSGSAMEPRNWGYRGSPRLWHVRGPCRTTVMAWWGGLAGVEEQGIDTIEVSQEPERSGRLHVERDWCGVANSKTPGPQPASGWWERRTQAHGVVASSEGNEARREGRSGVGVTHSTVEPGELDLGGPWGGKELP